VARILFAEDDENLSQLVVQFLQGAHHVVDTAMTGQEATDKLDYITYDVIVLDWNLPIKNGIDVLREFQSSGKSTPVLMVTARSTVSEKVIGLEEGATDYLTKPFTMEELAARIRALLRRAPQPPSSILKVGDIELDRTSFTAKRAGAEIKLVSKEFDLLEFFLSHPNQPFSAEVLLERVWHSESDSTTVRMCLMSLRKKLGSRDGSQYIKTVRGVGYLFSPAET